MKWRLLLLLCCAGLARADEAPPLPAGEAAAWLQRMAEAARRLSYEGEFYFQHGDSTQTLRVVNNAAAGDKHSLLTFMDGDQREVRCNGGEAVNITPDGNTIRVIKRPGNRHFPDLLPPDPASLGAWYSVRLGNLDRVANLGCQEVRLQPRDQFRWGYVLCAERNSHLPLRVVMINEAGQPLLKYAFTQVRIGRAAPFQAMPKAAQEADPDTAPTAGIPIQVRQLPPGFNRVAVLKRKLPKRQHPVDHWVYSDGLTYISMFMEQSAQPVEPVKGESRKGMINLLTRQVGDWRVTVLGDAPWAAVETMASGLAVPGK